MARTDKEIYMPNMSERLEIGDMQWPLLSNIVRILQTVALYNKKTKEQAGTKPLNVVRIQQALFEEGA